LFVTLLVKNVSASRKRTHNIVKDAELGQTFKDLTTKSDNYLMKLSKKKTMIYRNLLSNVQSNNFEQNDFVKNRSKLGNRK